MAQILDGRALGRSLNKALKAKVPTLPRPPGLAVVLVGTDPASQIYVNLKGRVAERLGFHHRQIDLPETTSQSDLRGLIGELNADDDIDGILVQLPLPEGLDAYDLVDRIDPGKDVDGLSDRNAGRLSQARAHLVPCTPKGIMLLLEQAGVQPKGLRVCVVGRSNIVGRPMAKLLEQAHATVTVCHSRTRDLGDIVRASDVVVAAVGVPELVRGEWIKEGAVVIDVGMNRLEDGKLVGDVEFEAAAERAAAITPVPGGVGPMTIAMLMSNTFEASAARQA
ncbi:MAG: bifunctional methylenetetrahydrofolate dehydrogenase/methenyltetrahydrofolate cyclohydrolase FolD [Deltaproteobacteria bacterium]|nr:bifunctional methylenetetrahydrofolate dehydrogenase/methenyltetrahydrofolate cyclohydrolase FolD [Deltaproteobacteria bacterium]